MSARSHQIADAGQLLAARLAHTTLTDPVVVPVGRDGELLAQPSRQRFRWPLCAPDDSAVFGSDVILFGNDADALRDALARARAAGAASVIVAAPALSMRERAQLDDADRFIAFAVHEEPTPLQAPRHLRDGSERANR